MKNVTSTKKWLWLVSVVAVLVAMACLFTACGDETQESQPTETVPSELYWNLDKALYTDLSATGLSARERHEDGLYHFRFATAGKVVELTCDDAQLVNYIDTMDAMGIVTDADGNIVDARPVSEFGNELVKEFFVKKVNGNTVQLNSSQVMNGMDVTVVIPDSAYIMDVRPEAETPAGKVELEIMDNVWIYSDMRATVTNVLLTKRPPKSELYTRVDRYYSGGKTTRVPDENGVYTIPFAVNGEIVKLKCKDMTLVSAIDAGTDTAVHMGLVFDEEGYIIDTMSGAEAVRGIATAVVFHVKEINGDQVTFIRKMPGNNQGEEITLTVNENTQIFNTEQGYMGSQCWAFDHFGELTDHLEIDDRVICYADSDNNALIIDVLVRQVKSKLYYNQSVKYNSATKETTRVPDEDGYYVFTFACEGKTVNLKTKDKKIASKVDSFSTGIVGLKVSGSIIKDACSSYCVAGWNTSAKMFVREVMGNVVTMASRLNINTVGNYVIADGCKTFDVTGNYGVKYGSATTVKPGDSVYFVRNAYGDMQYIFVTMRLSGGTKLYYSTARRFNTTTNETTRVPDENGYYVYDLLTETGKPVQAKTDSKAMADFIDLQLAPFISLKINSEGIITKAAHCESSLKWGMKYTGYHYIKSIDSVNKTYATYYMSGGNKVDSYTAVAMAENVKVYNFSTNFTDHRGEKTKLRVDDRIQAFYDAEHSGVSRIYILERTDPAVKKFCPHCNKTVTFYGTKSGAAPAGQTTHYYLAHNQYPNQISVGAKDEEKRTHVVLDLNGYTLNGAPQGDRTALVYGDLTIIDTKGGGSVVGTSNGWGGAIMVRETGKVNLQAGTYTYSADEKHLGATVGGIFWLAENSELNIAEGVKLTAGYTSGNGGLIYMEDNAVVNVDGGVLSAGIAAENGGNIYLTGSAVFNMNSGSLLSGTAKAANNVFIGSKTAQFNLGEGVAFDGGIGSNVAISYPVTGKVEWTQPVYLRGGAKLDLTGMDPASKLEIDADGVFTTEFKDVATAKSYLNCFTVPQDYKPVAVKGKALFTEMELEAFIEREMAVANAVKDLDPAQVVAGDTCPICGATNVKWVKKTGAVYTSTNAHFYFEGAVGTAEEPIVADNFFYGEQGINACVVLVDADIHTTGRILLRANNNFSFMGDGKITSTGTGVEGLASDRGLLSYTGSGAELNLYGGNYQYTGTGFGINADGTPVSATVPAYGLLNVTAGSAANIFNDAVIGNETLDTSRAYYNVYTAGEVNMFGGTVQNGVSGVAGAAGNVTVVGSGELNMYGNGIIKGGAAIGSAPAGANIAVTGASAVLNLGEAALEGGITIQGANTLPITGKVEWNKPVVLRGGAKLDLTGMDASSKLVLDAEGIFTTDFKDAATAEKYLSCFTVPQDYKIQAEGKALSAELTQEAMIDREMAVANAVKDLKPADVVAGTTCPICGAENVTWTKQTGAYYASANAHIYYEGAVGTAEAPIVADNFLYSAQDANVCVVLVDADIHTTGRILLRNNTNFSFMGTGKVVSDGTGEEGLASDRGLFSFLGSSTELNLYGGNYRYTGTGFGKKADGTAESTTNPVYALLNVTAGSEANIFNDTVIGNAEKDTTRAYYNVYTLGKVNLFGGTIQNGCSKVNGAGGNVTVDAGGVLNLYGGTIQNGEAGYRGGNILLLTGSSLNIYGENALITGGKATNAGGNIGTLDYIQNAVINMYDGTVSKGQAASGGNIFGWGTSAKNAAFNLSGGTVTEGKATNGGNIYIGNYLAVNIGKDAEVIDGTATSMGGNISVLTNASIISEGKIAGGTAAVGGGNLNLATSSGTGTFTMNGGEISGGKVTGTSGSSSGGNIRIWDNGAFTMNAGYIYGGSVESATGHGNSANIMVGGSAQAKVGKLTVNGGHIAGDIKLYANSSVKATMVVSGAPEIDTSITLADGVTVVKTKYAGLMIQSGAVLDISELKPEAKIVISAAKNQIISAASGNATAVAGCFRPTNGTLTVQATADNVLKVVAK